MSRGANGMGAGTNWEIDRTTYIRLLGEYDMTRDPSALAEFIPVINLEEAEWATSTSSP